MKREDTKSKIIDAALTLFAARGYDAVSVGEIAAAVGIRAPSLYNHFESKKAIFEAIVQDAEQRYDALSELSAQTGNSKQDRPMSVGITEECLIEKTRQFFLLSLHDTRISAFRRMLSIEQFRSPELARAYTDRYLDRPMRYYREFFSRLIGGGALPEADADGMALMCVAPLLSLLDVCDRQPEKEAECLEKLTAHVKLFYRTYTHKTQNHN